MHGLKLPGSHPATECQTRPEQRLSAPSHPDDATATPRPPGGSPISLHVYKAPGSREDIVTGADKEGILYYVRSTALSGWEIELRGGGKRGPVVGRSWKGPASSEMHVALVSGWSSELMKRGGFFSNTHAFTALNGSSFYEWDVTSRWTGAWKCINTSNHEAVATWRRAIWGATTDGLLIVSAPYVLETEVILITALGIEKWWREQHGATL